MAEYDLIAFDMDGTLLNSDKQISEDSRRAIETASSAGKHVVLSTGRCLPELVDLMPSIPSVRYLIAISGALIYDFHRKETIGRFPISGETVEEMLRRIGDADVMVHLHSDRSYVEREKAARMEYYQMGVYQRFFDKVATGVEDLKAVYLKERFPVYKFNIYPHEKAQSLYFREKFSDLPLSFAYAEIANLECSRAGISKASGLSALCEYLGTDVSRAIAVGDSDNDLTILRQAGLAIAMGNASESAMAEADVVVRDNDHGGCAQAIYEYLLK